MILTALVDHVARRLREAGRTCRTVVLRLRFQDFTRATRSCTAREPTARTHTILALALGLLERAQPMIERRGITLVGVALSGLAEDRPRQLTLISERSERLDGVLDRLRDRFGAEAITRGVLVGHAPGLTAPMLPD